MPLQNTTPPPIPAKMLARRFAESVGVPNPGNADFETLARLLNESHDQRRIYIKGARFKSWLGGEEPKACFFPIFAKVLGIPVADIVASDSAKPTKAAAETPLRADRPDPPSTKALRDTSPIPAPQSKDGAGADPPPSETRKQGPSAHMPDDAFDAELLKLRAIIASHDSATSPHDFWAIANERGLFERIPRTTAHHFFFRSKKPPTNTERSAFRSCFPEGVLAAIAGSKPHPQITDA